MSKLDDLWIWYECKCPKPIRWLIKSVFIIMGLAFHLVLLILAACVSAIFLHIIPEMLQEAVGDGWAAVIYFLFVFPVFLVILYGGGYLYIKIFFKK